MIKMNLRSRLILPFNAGKLKSVLMLWILANFPLSSFAGLEANQNKRLSHLYQPPIQDQQNNNRTIYPYAPPPPPAPEFNHGITQPYNWQSQFVAQNSTPLPQQQAYGPSAQYALPPNPVQQVQISLCSMQDQSVQTPSANHEDNEIPRMAETIAKTLNIYGIQEDKIIKRVYQKITGVYEKIISKYDGSSGADKELQDGSLPNISSIICYDVLYKALANKSKDTTGIMRFNSEPALSAIYYFLIKEPTKNGTTARKLGKDRWISILNCSKKKEEELNTQKKKLPEVQNQTQAKTNESAEHPTLEGELLNLEQIVHQELLDHNFAVQTKQYDLRQVLNLALNYIVYGVGLKNLDDKGRLLLAKAMPESCDTDCSLQQLIDGLFQVIAYDATSGADIKSYRMIKAELDKHDRMSIVEFGKYISDEMLSIPKDKMAIYNRVKDILKAHEQISEGVMNLYHRKQIYQNVKTILDEYNRITGDDMMTYYSVRNKLKENSISDSERQTYNNVKNGLYTAPNRMLLAVPGWNTHYAISDWTIYQDIKKKIDAYNKKSGTYNTITQDDLENYQNIQQKIEEHTTITESDLALYRKIQEAIVKANVLTQSEIIIYNGIQKKINENKVIKTSDWKLYQDTQEALKSGNKIPSYASVNYEQIAEKVEASKVISEHDVEIYEKIQAKLGGKAKSSAAEKFCHIFRNKQTYQCVINKSKAVSEISGLEMQTYNNVKNILDKRKAISEHDIEIYEQVQYAHDVNEAVSELDMQYYQYIKNILDKYNAISESDINVYYKIKYTIDAYTAISDQNTRVNELRRLLVKIGKDIMTKMKSRINNCCKRHDEMLDKFYY